MNKQTYEKILRPLSAGVLIMAVACLISLITLLWMGVKPGLLTAPENAESTGNKAGSLPLTPDYGSFYIDSMIFAGDKSIAGLIETGILKDGRETMQVWLGEGGDLPLDYSLDSTTIIYPETGKPLSIPAAAAEKKPQYLLITVGLSNGVAYCSEDSFKSYYGKLIDAIAESAPETKVILQSVLPVSKAYEKAHPGVSAQRIEDANRWICSLAEEKGVRYLDSAAVLCDKQGYLLADCDSGNGFSLNKAGYEKLLTYIRTHGYQ